MFLLHLISSILFDSRVFLSFWFLPFFSSLLESVLGNGGWRRASGQLQRDSQRCGTAVQGGPDTAEKGYGCSHTGYTAGYNQALQELWAFSAGSSNPHTANTLHSELTRFLNQQKEPLPATHPEMLPCALQIQQGTLLRAQSTANLALQPTLKPNDVEARRRPITDTRDEMSMFSSDLAQSPHGKKRIRRDAMLEWTT